jgi:transposase
MTEKSQDSTIKERIIGLLRKGYSRSQLINDFNFAERTVESAIKEYKEQQGDEAEETKRADEPAG